MKSLPRFLPITFSFSLPSPRRPSFAALVLVAGIGPMALDTYMPAMPQMRASLHTTPALVQLTITGYIIGMAVGQLLAGPVSDGVGRRPLLLPPAVVFTAAAVVCASAPNATILVAARLIHGIAAGATVACGRAVVSDRFRGGDLATRFGTLTAITQVGPVIAPGLGSAIMSIGSWRTIFWGMALLGAVMVMWIAVAIPETLPPARRHSAGVASSARRMLDLLRHWDFSKNVVVLCLATFGFFIYIGGASLVMQTVYGISDSAFAVMFSVNASVMVAGTVVYRLTVSACGPRRLRAIGVAVATAAAFALLVVAFLGRWALPGLMVPWVLLAVVTGSMGLVLPAAMSMGQEAGDRARGTASSLQGGLCLLAGALASPMTGLFGDASLLPMAALMATGFGMAVLALNIIARPGSRRPGVRPMAEPDAVEALGLLAIDDFVPVRDLDK